MKQGWEIKKLGEVIVENRKSTLKSKGNFEGEFPFFISGKNIKTIDKSIIDGNNIYLPTGGNFFIHYYSGKASYSTDTWSLRTNVSTSIKYLFYFLLLNEKLIGDKYFKGATIKHLQKKDFKDIEIPIPTLPEQKHIVSILEEAFDAIAKAKTNAEQNLKNAKELIESYLQGVFEKKGYGWEEKKLGDVVSKIMTGPFGSMLHQSDYVEEGIPVVNPQNIVDGKIIPLSKTMINQDTFSRLAKYALILGDIVIARRGEMGRCAVVRKENINWLCGTGSFVIRVNPKKADSNFLNIILSSNSVKQQLEKSSIGATMSNLNQTILSELPIRIPSVEEQQTIVRQLDALRTETQKLEAVYQKKLDDLEELKKSILQKAFAGELIDKTKQVFKEIEM
ncbi:MAG: hypothetical protein BGO32_02325 [Bacteroidetes bacterium 37-13]|nr:restriction endonuclease subunit S [Bacteroidota bacterium]OJV28670.1 MAG: hypothetical protein BGO32_02325 [Bacteroidetes bacterium 37-13]